MNILVTGAAGYIGSIVAEELIGEEHRVIALDDLSQGHRQAVDPRAVFILGDYGDSEVLHSIFHNYAIDVVMYPAAKAGMLPITDPGEYFETDFVKSINLFNSMLKHKVNKLVFSSSAAIYGKPQPIPIRETDPQFPLNAYGQCKLVLEKILGYYVLAYDLKSISLRYFNASGASHRFGQDHHPETSLIPNVLKVALGQSEYVTVFGSDYPTRDGTCVRDYVHVLDLAQAHILALNRIGNTSGAESYNLGNGSGYTVLEVVEVARKVTGKGIPYKVVPRRDGDTAVMVANYELARKELGWQPRYPELEAIIVSAWQWMKKHPRGYER
jgi:UDP-glucose 4-epimerase